MVWISAAASVSVHPKPQQFLRILMNSSSSFTPTDRPENRRQRWSAIGQQTRSRDRIVHENRSGLVYHASMQSQWLYMRLEDGLSGDKHKNNDTLGNRWAKPS